MLASERPRRPRSGLGSLGAASAASEVVPDEVGHVAQIIQKCDGREVEGHRVPRGGVGHPTGVVLRVGVVVPAEVGQVRSPRIATAQKFSAKSEILGFPSQKKELRKAPRGKKRA